MRLSIIYRAVSITSLLAIALVAACGSDMPETNAPATPAAPTAGTTADTPDRLDVVSTIYAVTYFAERIGADLVSVDSLVQPGAEAHAFEPTAGDLRKLALADVVVFANDSFESWVSDALNATTSSDRIVVSVVELEENFESEQTNEDEHTDENEHGDEHADEDDHGDEYADEDEHVHGGGDPHTWLNPLEAISMVESIRDAMQSADPENSQVFAQNAAEVVAELRVLNAAISVALTSCELDAIVVSHLAYGHMLEPHGIEQVGLAGLEAEIESSAQAVASIVQEIEELGIRHILQEPALSSRLAETVASETGATLLVLHPLEALTPDEIAAGDDYFSVMNRNIESLVTALRCA